MRIPLFFPALALVMFPAMYLYAQGPQYVVTDLGTLGGTSSDGNAVNNAGQVTGSSGQHAFLYSDGSMTDLGTLGGTLSGGVGINNAGQVTGFTNLAGNSQVHAFLYSGGSMKDLGTLGGSSSGGIGINNAGQVTGYAYTSGDTAEHTFLYSGGSMTDLGAGSITSGGEAINNTGEVTGIAYTSSAEHAVLYSGGNMTDLGTLGGAISWGNGINNAGQVTGYSETSGDTAQHAFLYSGGSMMDLGTLGGSSSIGYALNNAGQVTGTAVTTGGTSHAFLYSGGTMYDVNNLVSSVQGVTGINVLDAGVNISGNHINDLGQIAASGTVNGQTHAVLLTPRAMGTQFSGGLGDLPGGIFQSAVVAVSNGGAVAAGSGANSFGSYDAMTWTLNGGMVGANLNTSGAHPNSSTSGLSDSGLIAVGNDGANAHAFRMNTSTGALFDMANLPGQQTGTATSVSGNGNFAAGSSGTVSGSFQHAVRWDQFGNATDLGTLPGGNLSEAQAISGDGSVVAGWSFYSGGGSNLQAFRWTASGGMQPLGFLSGGSTSLAIGISSDSTTIVGQSQVTGGSEAFRWTSAGGMVALGNFAGGALNSTAAAASSDGQIIVGSGTDAGGGKAFIWDTAHGFRNLQSVLSSEYGVDFSGWTLTSAAAISSDGTEVGGTAVDPEGNEQGFIAQVNSRTYRYVSGENHSGFHTSHLGGFGTSVDVLGGIAGGVSGSFKTLTIQMQGTGAATVLPLHGFASDLANVSGIDGDTFVLKLSYDPTTAIALFGSSANARLDWLNPNTNLWENAVDGDTGGTPQFMGDGAYNPATDFQLGDYGVDTADNDVWAVVNHNSQFAVSGVPEPGSVVLLGFSLGLLGVRRRIR